MTQRTTRAERMAQPRAADAIKALAEASGGCIRPVQLRRTDLDTGQVEQVIVPCGATLATCARPAPNGAKSLRAAQCREGWHLEDEPIPPPAPARRLAGLAAGTARRAPAAPRPRRTPQATRPPGWMS